MINNFFLILWCIQLFFESLPVSSSGHRKIFVQLMKYFGLYENELELKEDVEFAMHFPTLFIIIFFCLFHLKELIINPASLSSELFFFIQYLFISSFVTGIFYLLFKFIDIKKIPIGIGFLITSILLLSLNFKSAGTILYPSLTSAFFIGTMQGISFLPGISRLAITYTAFYFLSLDPTRAFLFSLLIQIPIIIVALFKTYFDGGIKFLFSLKFSWYIILLFFSFISFFLLFLLMYLIKSNLLWVFAFYTMILFFIKILFDFF